MGERSRVIEAEAIVVTYRRPRLATQVVRQLVEIEGFLPSQVHLVVNGEGGLEDRHLQRGIDTLTLPENVGASGGFRAGLQHVASSSGVPWLYACEDDVGLFTALPSPRVRRLIARVGALVADGAGERVGAVVAYGRDIDRRTGVTTPHAVRGSTGFEEVDTGAWGATLLSREVVERGLYPDPRFFWGLADLEYFLQLRAAGLRVLVDREAAWRLDEQATRPRRAWVGHRPGRAQESWCSYYYARNFFELRRRYGTPLWTLRHLTKCARRFQLAPTEAHRRAIVRGCWDGVRGRMGKNPAFVRTVGELGRTDAPPTQAVP
jgi:GT2 family glycosyltransferase